MKLDQYWCNPKKAVIERGEAEAWWYANGSGIELHIEPALTCGHVVVRLRRSTLKQYLAKSAK